jgi:hypothetical protein
VARECEATESTQAQRAGVVLRRAQFDRSTARIGDTPRYAVVIERKGDGDAVIVEKQSPLMGDLLDVGPPMITRPLVASPLGREVRTCEHARAIGKQFVAINFDADQWCPHSGQRGGLEKAPGGSNQPEKWACRGVA